jgi:hypothetical protein
MYIEKNYKLAQDEYKNCKFKYLIKKKEVDKTDERYDYV